MSQPQPSLGGAYPMSAREQQVLLMLAQGLRAREIALILQVSPSSVYSFFRLLKARFGVNTLAGMLNRATTTGVLAALEDSARLAEPQPEGTGG